MKRKNLIKGALILFALGGLYISSATFNASASGFFTGTGPLLPPLVTAPPSSKCVVTSGEEKHNFSVLQETMEDCYSCIYGDVETGLPNLENHEITFTYRGTESKRSMIKIGCIETQDYNDTCQPQGFSGSLEPVSCPDFSWTEPYNEN